MRDYLAVFGGAREQVSLAVQRIAAANSEWSPIAADHGWAVLAPKASAMRVRPLPARRGVIIGDLFERGASGPLQGRVSAISTPQASAEVVCQSLCRHYWGRYVAVVRGADDQGVQAFRDPSGMLDCVTWRAGGLAFVASTLPDWLAAAFLPVLAIDYPHVHRMLLDRSAEVGALGLKGVVAVNPGALQAVEAAEAARMIWRPQTFVGVERQQPKAAAQDLRDAVITTVSALTSPHRPILAELSGGLDSAIVMAALREVRSGGLHALNYFFDAGEGDERRYARDVASKLDVPLHEAERPDLVLTRIPDAAVTSVRPSLSALDGLYEQDLIQHARAVGADQIFTGQGGDSVFFRYATPLVLVDELSRIGLGALRPQSLAQTARRNGISVWALLAGALRRGSAPTGMPTLGFAVSDGATAEDHPWTLGLERWPAKRLQIEGLISAQAYFTATHRGAELDLCQPLLAQPVVEAALRLPVSQLTLEGRDRGLARRLFCDQLPGSVIHRRSKGSAASFYARVVTSSLGFLKPHLLDGRLAALGMVDRPRLEAALDPSQMIWTGGQLEILQAAVLEGWLRHWEERVARSPARLADPP
ncbi:asparagine synthase-related protein [Caulobacter sp. NIBR2454]|uniref:asparagine synthase-related protein n=1 Tax=Caulobacter sp. NIBR2454 TaxID=3015996 RepID=UPI0022B62F40|nr:asparagine synthase-related protein [Caulobacter sp. NIBR2454]